MAQRAQKESVPDQGRENHVSHNYENDADPGVYVVRKCQKKTEKGEQNDVGTKEFKGGRR